jgi:hypothetical protein
MIQVENQDILPNYPLLPGGTVDIHYVTPGGWFQDSEGFDSEVIKHLRKIISCFVNNQNFEHKA